MRVFYCFATQHKLTQVDFKSSVMCQIYNFLQLASFLLFGYPSQVHTQVLVLQTCVDLHQLVSPFGHLAYVFILLSCSKSKHFPFTDSRFYRTDGGMQIMSSNLSENFSIFSLFFCCRAFSSFSKLCTSCNSVEISAAASEPREATSLL